MEYRVLGKLEVLRDGQPVDLGAFRQRALLALLLTAPNSVFSTDQLLDELWGDAGGVDKQNALWVYVSGLRKALEPDREKRTDGSILLTRAPGYLIEAAAEQIDSLRFERLVTEGRALADVDPAAASLVLGESLALWRGRAFEEFTYGITVEFMPDEAQAPLNRALDEPNRRPDVALDTGPIPAWAARRALDISRFIDPGTLRSDFGAYLLSVGTTAGAGGALPADAPVSAIPLTIGLKSLVYYPKAKFREAGYEIPNTWKELVALSHQIAADGGTPWCFGFESGYADG